MCHFCAILGLKIIENRGIPLNSKSIKTADFQGKAGTAGVIAFELIKRAYESNTLEKLRDFLSAEPQPVTG